MLCPALSFDRFRAHNSAAQVLFYIIIIIIGNKFWYNCPFCGYFKCSLLHYSTCSCNQTGLLYWKCFCFIYACDIDKVSKHISGEDWIVLLFVSEKTTEFFTLLLLGFMNVYLIATYTRQPMNMARITAPFLCFVVQSVCRVKLKEIWGIFIHLGLELYRK